MNRGAGAHPAANPASAQSPFSIPVMAPSPRPVAAKVPGSAWIGVLLLAVGGGIMAVGSGSFPAALAGVRAPLWVILAAGACFALAGLSFFRNRLPEWLAGLIPCLIATLFAAIPAWVAFDDGPREFMMALGGAGFAVWWNDVSVGRIAFGCAAVLTGLVALLVWGAWWRGLSLAGRLIALPLGGLAAWLWFVVVPAEPHWDGLADDHERLRRYGQIGEQEGWSKLTRGRQPVDWIYPPWRDLDAWSKAARARLAARRGVPAGIEVLTVPVADRAPRIDGVIDAAEWQGALVLPMGRGDGRAQLHLLSDGRRLFLAGDVPADTTAAGFDQFRFWFHLDLSPALPYERAFLDGSGGGVNVMRSAVFAHGRNGAFHRTDSRTHRKARGASTLDGHRRYEMALDLAESGLRRGVPFPAFIDVEGDPERHPDGRFKARVIVGQAGSLQEPLWLQVAP